MLPACAARDVLYQRAARQAEVLGDLDSAWESRCTVLESSSSHEAPRFETLFLCMAWCLKASDRDPDRFSPNRILWQYKWVAVEAPRYASVPRRACERLIDDMEARYAKIGWGRRAAIHKRIELHALLGEHEKAIALLPEWRALARDRGADCLACEADFLVSLLGAAGHSEHAVREARPIIRGKLSCATVPHSTFAALLNPLVRLGRVSEADDLFQRGRRLLKRMRSGGYRVAGEYMLHAARIGDVDASIQIARGALPQAASERADVTRFDWFSRLGTALAILAGRGVDTVDLPKTALTPDGADSDCRVLAERMLATARDHARALDRRNGNGYYESQLHQLADDAKRGR